MTEPANSTPWYGDFRLFRNRIIPGLLVVLPFFITYAVVYWLYDVLYTYAIGPIAWVLREYSLGGAEAGATVAEHVVPAVNNSAPFGSQAFFIDVVSSDGKNVIEGSFPATIESAAAALAPLHSPERRVGAAAALRPSLQSIGGKSLVQRASHSTPGSEDKKP